MHIDFAGKTVIVTGGGHGFGRAIAHAFAARGAAAWTCDINAEGLRATKAEAKPAPGGRLAGRWARPGSSPRSSPGPASTPSPARSPRSTTRRCPTPTWPPRTPERRGPCGTC